MFVCLNNCRQIWASWANEGPYLVRTSAKRRQVLLKRTGPLSFPNLAISTWKDLSIILPNCWSVDVCSRSWWRTWWWFDLLPVGWFNKAAVSMVRWSFWLVRVVIIISIYKTMDIRISDKKNQMIIQKIIIKFNGLFVRRINYF